MLMIIDIYHIFIIQIIKILKMTIADVSNVGNVLATSGSVTGVVTICALFIIYHMANQYTSIMDAYMT